MKYIHFVMRRTKLCYNRGITTLHSSAKTEREISPCLCALEDRLQQLEVKKKADEIFSSNTGRL